MAFNNAGGSIARILRLKQSVDSLERMNVQMAKRNGSATIRTALGLGPRWTGIPIGSLHGGILHSDFHHAVIGNNVIMLGTGNDLRVRECPTYAAPLPGPTEDCNQVSTPPTPVTPLPCLDTLPPGYRRAWFNNRSLTGNLLNVRVLDNGLNRQATQQQWPGELP